jgi:site-specific recombinase XerD
MVRAEVDIRPVQLLLGHQSIATTQVIYTMMIRMLGLRTIPQRFDCYLCTGRTP